MQPRELFLNTENLLQMFFGATITKDAVQLSSTGAKSLMNSEEYKTQEFVYQYLLAMKNKMLTAVAEVNKWKRIIISQHDVEQQARLEYMSKSERELWQKYFETLGQKKQLEEFLKTLRKPDESQKEELQAYKEVVAGIKAKIYSLFTASLVMKLRRESDNLARAVDALQNEIFAQTLSDDNKNVFKAREVHVQA